MSNQGIAGTPPDPIDRYLDGTITPAEFAILESELASSPGLRAEFRRRAALESNLREAFGHAGDEAPGGAWLAVRPAPAVRSPARDRVPAFYRTAAAAAVAFTLGAALIHWTSPGEPAARPRADAPPETEEAVAEGFAVVARLIDAEWADGAPSYSEGETLGADRLEIAGGAAELQFFSGATMSIEGPARISLRSAWEATCEEGAIRMRVPPAARGFKLNAPATEIVDLGTEFGLAVEAGAAQVEVFDGEIEVSHRGAGARLLRAGGALDLPPGAAPRELRAGGAAFPDPSRFDAARSQRITVAAGRARAHREALASDPRLIAFYSFEGDGQTAANLARDAAPETHGTPVLAERTSGRTSGVDAAFEFGRPGSRVRVNLPGEFPALTFAAWVRIDSLDRRYSALFMGDGYETGEPHWQIREDGRLMLSVMVDDAGRHPLYPEKSRYHHVYFSPPIWEHRMGGRWFHLASTFDPDRSEVCHYLNGEQVSLEPIEPLFRVRTLRIGNAEIGNWGEPFRKDPTFAIRNLNGRVDEIAVFEAALDGGEIAELYRRSRPLSH